MSIQYAGGTIVNTTLTQSAGTRAELADWIKDELVAAGWTLAVSGTHDWKLNSATTPQSLQSRVRSYDPGSGNCARLKFSNVSESKIQAGDMFLLPAVSKVWRIIANKYQFFVFTPGSSAPREVAYGGCLFLPSFLNSVITEQIWAGGNSEADGTSTVRTNFRTKLYQGAAGNAPNWFGVVNGSVYEINNNPGASSGSGTPRLWSMSQMYMGDGNTANVGWHDDSLIVSEPLLSHGLTASADTGKIRGQLWDSVIITDAFAADANITLDSRTYWAITNTNSGIATEPRGTLFVAVT